MRTAALIAFVAGAAGWLWIGWELRRGRRKPRHARGDGYVDGVLDRGDDQ